MDLAYKAKFRKQSAILSTRIGESSGVLSRRQTNDITVPGLGGLGTFTARFCSSFLMALLCKK